jgi:hypothetical protein
VVRVAAYNTTNYQHGTARHWGHDCSMWASLCMLCRCSNVFMSHCNYLVLTSSVGCFCPTRHVQHHGGSLTLLSPRRVKSLELAQSTPSGQITSRNFSGKKHTASSIVRDCDVECEACCLVSVVQTLHDKTRGNKYSTSYSVCAFHPTQSWIKYYRRKCPRLNHSWEMIEACVVNNTCALHIWLGLDSAATVQ